MNIVMVAAENDALVGGKVGGIGDVIRDIPRALSELGHRVDVVTPGYQYFSTLPGARLEASFELEFGWRPETVSLFEVPPKTPCNGVTYWALEHPLFAAGGVGKIYCDDPDDRPFATDASKFALFSLATAVALGEGLLPLPDVLHLHDWHSAMVAVLKRCHPRCEALRDTHTVFSIHNLSLQGIRPFDGDESSLIAWFGHLLFDVEAIRDPRFPDCINAMRAGITLSDRVHAVSPTYAQEIQRASDAANGFFGGEGLEADLRRAARDGRLHGILNGTEYPADLMTSCARADLYELCTGALENWIAAGSGHAAAHRIARLRLAQWEKQPRKTGALLTSVGRITAQKVLLLQHRLADGRSGLEALLDSLGKQDRLLMLGSGDGALEEFLIDVASRHENFLFLNGYAESLPDAIYAAGDLFLMPSSFEPCGISQMLAMRAGQPCLVHGVGGLLDTVRDDQTGFVFTGRDLNDQVIALLSRLTQALRLRREQPTQWEELRSVAADQRFLWRDAASDYQRLLYEYADA